MTLLDLIAILLGFYGAILLCADRICVAVERRVHGPY